MKIKKTHTALLLLLFIVVLLCFLLNISVGSVGIPLVEVLAILFGDEGSSTAREYIVIDYRLPKAITAIIAGSGLAITGLLMQTLFKNPLAGPFVLGISSGASLGVALFILGGSLLGITYSLNVGQWGLIIAASLGSFLVLLAVILVAARIRDTMALLIIGLMVGSLTGALVSILAFFSKAEELQQFIFWSFGSLGDNSWDQIVILSICYFIGILLVTGTLKSLNALLLGEAYAQTLGVNINRNRMLILLATSILAGSITAFAGPIAFIGLAVPHLVRQIIPTSNHQIIVPAVLLGGAALMLLCDTIAQLPTSAYTLPINAITALFGAPVVIWLLVRKKKLIF